MFDGGTITFASKTVTHGKEPSKPDEGSLNPK